MNDTILKIKFVIHLESLIQLQKSVLEYTQCYSVVQDKVNELVQGMYIPAITNGLNRIN